MQEVRRLAMALLWKKSPPPESEKACHCAGHLNAVLGALLDYLDADYREHQNEQAQVSYSVEYVIQGMPRRGDAVGVLARLYSAQREGSVLYGPILRRESKDHYSLWIDEDQ
jgi:hypothetical protein